MDLDLDYVNIFFWWNLLAWMAVGIRCELSIKSVMSICQMFWLMLLWPPIMAIVGAIAWCAGTAISESQWSWHSILNDITNGFLVLIGFISFIAIIAIIVEKAPKCKIVWRKKYD